MDFATLHALQPVTLDSAANAYADVGARTAAEADSWDTGVVNRTRANWQGGAADQAVQQLQQTESRLAAGADNLRAVGLALREAAEQLTQCQAQLQQWIQEAQADGFVVAPDGSLTADPARPTGSGMQQAHQNMLGQALMEAQAQILDQATAVDQQSADRLQTLTRAAEQGVGTGSAGQPGGGASGGGGGANTPFGQGGGSPSPGPVTDPGTGPYTNRGGARYRED